MRFNSTGLVASGDNAQASQFAITGVVQAASGVGSANRQPGPATVAPSWISDSLVAIFVWSVTPPELRSYNTATTAQTLLVASDVNVFAAGQSKWALQKVSAGVSVVLSNVTGATSLVGARLGDVGTDDGSLAIVVNDATGQGLKVYNAFGDVTLNLPDVVVTNYGVHVRASLVAYSTATNWQLIGVAGAETAYAARLSAINWMTPCTLGGIVYVLERGFTAPNDVLTVREAGNGSGWQIATGANVLNPDIVALSSGLLRIGWSVSTGEAPADCRFAEVNPVTDEWRQGTFNGAGSFTWGPWAAADSQTFEVGPASGGLDDATTGLPRQDHPLVNPKTGIIDPIWLGSLSKTNSAVETTVSFVESRVVVPPVTTPGFTSVASPNQPTLGAATSPVLTVVGADGLTVHLNPATNTMTLGQKSGRIPVSLVSDDTDPGFAPPGKRGTAGTNGRDGKTFVMSGVDADDFPMFGPPGKNGSNAGSYVPVSTGAEPLVIMSNGAGSVLLTPYTP